MIEKYTIVCLSSQAWDSHWTPVQQIMSRLAEKNSVLFVEPPKSFLVPFKKDSTWSLTKKIRSVSDNLTVLSLPTIFFPFFSYTRCGFLHKINTFFILKILSSVTASYDINKILLWVFSVTANEFVKETTFPLIVYDCIDEWVGAVSDDPVLKKAVYKMDRTLCEKSDIVFVGSKPMIQIKTPFNSKTFYVPHAADIEHFSKSADKNIPVAEDIANIQTPIVGLVGMMDMRIDIELLEYIATKQPTTSFVYVGKVLPDLDINKLKRMNNVYFLGMKPVSRLPDYIRAFTVCIIPYLINEFTRNIYPLKLHEYMASGKPIVCTPIPACFEYSDLIEIADKKELFNSALENVLKGDDILRTNKRKEIALKNSWEKRINDKSKIILDHLNKNN